MADAEAQNAVQVENLLALIAAIVARLLENETEQMDRAKEAA